MVMFAVPGGAIGIRTLAVSLGLLGHTQPKDLAQLIDLTLLDSQECLRHR